MPPAFRIVADAQVITEVIRTHLLSLTVVDEAGRQNDRLTIRIDDRRRETGGGIALPRTGAELEVSIGYAGKLQQMGIYVVDELEIEGPPAALTIRARAAAFDPSLHFTTLQTQKTRAWHQTTLGDLVRSIAAEHGYQPSVAIDYDGVPIPHLDQVDESDMNLLTRLGTQYGAVAKPAGGHLIFTPRGRSGSVSGQTIAPVTLRPADVTSWRGTLTKRGKFRQVIAQWRDLQAALTRSKTAGKGEPIYRLTHLYPDAAQALAAARSKLDQLTRGAGELELTLPGDPTILAETPLNLTGFRDGLDGPWTTRTATHKITSSGYTTTLAADARP